jgi:hypothetical protein
VANDLHDSALVLELFELVLLYDFLLDFFDGHRCVLPSASIHYTVATLGQLSVVLQLVEWDLVVLVEHTIFIHHVHETLVLVGDASANFLANILLVGSRLFELAEHLALLLAETAYGLLLLLGKALLKIFTVILALFSTWFHDDLLTKALDLRLQLLHLIQVWAIFISMLVDHHLGALSLGLLTNNSVRCHDLIVEIRTLLLGKSAR